MINFEKGLSYNDYMKLGTDDDKQMNVEFFKKSPIHSEPVVTSNDSNLNIAVFSMTRCKDAATVIPVLLQMTKNNPNATIKFFDKEGNEDLLRKLTGDIRIPTILKLDSNGNILNAFLEFPTAINKIIANNPTTKESIVTSFREGAYFSEIKKDLLLLL